METQFKLNLLLNSVKKVKSELVPFLKKHLLFAFVVVFGKVLVRVYVF